MRLLSIKNFDQYQHYKDRRPPWIKLHAAVLDDYAFSCLQDASKAHLMLLWVLASKLDNKIPFDLPFISKRLGTTSPIDIEELVLHGFIEVSQDDSTPLAPRKQSAMPETETETETEKRHIPAKAVSWPGDAAEVWKAVAPIGIPRLGKALKPVVDEYGWPDTRAGLLCYIEMTEGRARKAEWFAEDAVRWIRLGKQGNIDPVTGGFTERGKLVEQIVRRAS